MTYVPQTRWIGNGQPMQDPEPDQQVKTKRLRQMSRNNIITLLQTKQWLTAVEIATALNTAPATKDQVKTAERTMRRMYQHQVVDRKRSEADKFIFGLAG